MGLFFDGLAAPRQPTHRGQTRQHESRGFGFRDRRNHLGGIGGADSSQVGVADTEDVELVATSDAGNEVVIVRNE